MEINRSDLEKIHDALSSCEEFLKRRDEMNAAMHLGPTRHSPLTSVVMAELDRVKRLLGAGGGR